MDIEETARAIVWEIVDDLTSRRGLRQEWEAIDKDIQESIKSTWFESTKRIILEETQC